VFEHIDWAVLWPWAVVVLLGQIAFELHRIAKHIERRSLQWVSLHLDELREIRRMEEGS